MKLRQHRLLPALMAALGAVEPNSCWADSTLVLEEIVVTAQKRVESLADTPMTVNVVSGERIAEFATFSFEDINNMTAGLSISGSNFETDIATRGLGTDLNAAVAPRITVYLDGAIVQQERGLFSGLYDLQQLELLRGPQGTLYGQASPAGAITISSRDPDLEEIDAYIQQSFTDRQGSNTQAAISIPLIPDKLGVRIAGLYDTNENQDVRNITLDKDNENQTTAYRVVALWRPTDEFSLRVAYHDIDDEFDIDQVVKGNGIDFDDRKAVGDFEATMENDTELTIVEANYMFANDWSATLVASHQNNLVTREIDFDGSPVRGAEQWVVSDVPDVENYELRLASQGNGFWNWTVGGFFQDSESETPVYVDNYIVPLPGITVLAKVSGPAINDAQVYGLFSHNTIQLSAAGEITAGLRYNKAKRRNVQDFVLNYFLVNSDGSLRPVGGDTHEGVRPDDQKDDQDAVTGTLKYQYRFSEALMAYASYDRGWRAGSANISGRPNPPAFGVFDAEDSDNFEIGFKWGLLEGRGLLNVAAYYQVYSEFQYQANSVDYRLADGGIGLADPVVNVDEVESYGFDSDLTVLLAENWTLSAALSYNHAEISDAKNVPCSANEPLLDEPWDFKTCDLTGERAGEQPEWSGNLATEYSQDLGVLGGEWYLRALFNAESEYYSNSEGEDLDSYATLDVFFGLRSEAGTWDANLWVKNLFDASAELKTQRLPEVPDYGSSGAVDSGYTWVKRQLNPRTAGVTLSYYF